MNPKKKSPTIYDVAELANVSISTISRVLNSPEKVNPQTRSHVFDVIDKLGFVPKAEARARALRRTGRIGVITPFFTAPSFVQRLRGVASALSKANYELVIYPVDSMDHLQGYISSIPVMGSVDGLIIMSLSIEDNDAIRLHKSGIETALIEYSHPKLNSIVINDIQGGKLAAEYLIRKGHKRIGFLGDIEPSERYAIHPVKSRLLGFQQALQKANIPLPEDFIRSCSYTEEDTKKVAQELLSMPEPPSAIFAASDIQAVIVMRVARQMNIKIPDDLAIIGFDDIDIAELVDLTTIRQHLDESGRLATELLLSRISDPDRALHHVNIPLTLIERLTA